jgi:hypothetical protein
MSLIIGATPFSQWERMKPLFQQLGLSAQPSDTSALPGAVASSTTPCLLLHTRPELAVAQAIAEGASPNEALAQWITAAQALLGVLRANRSQCLMVDVHSALKAPAQLLDWLRNNRPSWLTLPVGAPTVVADAVELPDERHLLLATQLVAQSGKVQPLLAPLEASTVPLVTGQYAVPKIDVEQLQQRWQVESQELESLKQSLQQAQSELEKAQKAQQQNAGQSNATDQAERTRLERQVQSLTSEKASLEKQNKDTLNQLFKVQEELEKYHLQTKELKEQLRVANRDLDQAQKKLKAMESSPFWRITAPLRFGLGLVKTLLRKIKRFLARR